MSMQAILENSAPSENNSASAIATTAYEVGCPYLVKSAICSAALSSLVPTVNAKRAFCINEDYDNCPIFLAKILRRR